MARFWNGIKLPVGIYIYEGINKTSITMIFKYNGRNRHEVLEVPVVNENAIIEAGLKYKMIIAQIKSGNFNYEMWFPQSIKLAKTSSGLKKDYTVKEYRIEYLKEVIKQGKSPTTIDGYITVLNQIGKYFSSKKISEITQSDIKKWIRSLNSSDKEPITKKTISNKLSILKMMLEQAVDDEIIELNPVTNLPFNTIVKRMHLPKKTKAIYTFNETEQSYIFSVTDEIESLIFVFWFETGLRTNEIIELKISDINFETSTLSISRGRVRGVNKFEVDKDFNIKKQRESFIKAPKTDAGVREIQLSQIAIDVAKKQIEFTKSTQQDDYLFLHPKTLKPWSSDKQIRLYWHEIMNKTDLEYRYPYQIRHTFGSMGVKNMRDLGSIAQDMGHETLEPLINNYCKGISKKMRIKKK